MNYTIVRSHRRTMAIQIKRDGRVVVRAPYAATDEEVRQLVEKHRGWIEKSLARQREAPAASPPELTEQEMEELRRRGQEILPGRVVYWAARMDIPWKPLMRWWSMSWLTSATKTTGRTFIAW